MKNKNEYKEKEKWVWNLFSHVLKNFSGTVQDGNPRESFLETLDGKKIKIRSYLNYQFCVKIDISVQTKEPVWDVIGSVIREISE